MKTFARVVSAGVVIIGYAATASAAETAPPARPKLAAPSGLTVRVVPDPDPAPRAPTPTPTPAADPAKPLPPDVAKAKAVEEANRVHIRSTTYVAIDTPPPPRPLEPPRSEMVAGRVWQPGYWKPVAGKWEWVPGEWGVPPSPESVWLEPSYDPDTRHWSAGYWQPDREDSYEPVASGETPPPKLYGEKPAGSGLFY